MTIREEANLIATKEPFRLVLRWTCAGCGWSIDMETPGFPGSSPFTDDGVHCHYGPPNNLPCGPLSARLLHHVGDVIPEETVRRAESIIGMLDASERPWSPTGNVRAVRLVLDPKP